MNFTESTPLSALFESDPQTLHRLLRIADVDANVRLYNRGRHVAETDIEPTRFLDLLSRVLREYSLASEAELETIGTRLVAARNALDVPRIELRRSACPRALAGTGFRCSTEHGGPKLADQIVRSGVVFAETFKDEDGREISIPSAEWIGTTPQLHALLRSDQSRLNELEKKFIYASRLADDLASYGFERGDNAVTTCWVKGRRNWRLRKAGFES